MRRIGVALLLCDTSGRRQSVKLCSDIQINLLPKRKFYDIIYFIIEADRHCRAPTKIRIKTEEAHIMKCIYCGNAESKVVDSRSTDDGNSIRRRRECLQCGKRFTTYEVIESTPVLVVKNDGTRQPFDPLKIKSGVIKSCEKRPVAIRDIDALVTSVEKQVYNSLEQEVQSRKIGELVMERLKELDPIAYVRFASVYRDFRDVTTFIEFINEFK